MAKENGTGATTATQERAETIRIANIKSVAEKLGKSEQRVRNLLHELDDDGNPKLTYEVREVMLDGTDIPITLNVIPNAAIEQYLANVASGKFGARGGSDSVAYVVWLPAEDGTLTQDAQATLTDLEARGLRVALRNKPKAEGDASANGSTPNATADDAAKLKREQDVNAERERKRQAASA